MRKMWQNIESYRNYCIDSNQILHNDRPRDHQVVIVGGPNTRPTNPRWRTVAILKKNIKSPYLCNRLIDFDEIWHGDPYSGRPLKFELLKIQDGGGGQLENHKIAISPQRFDWFLRNVVRWCKMGLLIAPARTAAILKAIKSSYICKFSTNFDDIWHGDWCILVSRTWRKVKVLISTVLYGGQPQSRESKNCSNIFRNYKMTHYINLAIKQQFSTVLTATDQKPQKSLKCDVTQQHVHIQVIW